MRAWFQQATTRAGSLVSVAILTREATRSSRRWQTYAVRTLFAGLLVASLLLSIHATVRAANTGLLDIAQMGRVGRWLFVGYAFVQMSLVATLAPLTTANAVREETEQRTLDLLLLTELSPSQIVFGKVLSRIGILLTMVLGGMPVLLLAVNMGGVSGLEVVALTVHSLTVALMGAALGGFFALFTRSPLLSTLAALAYGIPFYAVLPAAYALTLGSPEAAAHFSPLSVAAASGYGALIVPVSYLPSLLVILKLLTDTFALRASGASFQEAYSHDLWQTKLWGKGVVAWVLLALPAMVVFPMAWLDKGTNVGLVGIALATATDGYLWLVAMTGYAVCTWLYLRISFDVVDAVDGIFGRRGDVVPAHAVRVGNHPVWWRETRHGTLTIGPIVATWGMVMLGLLQTGWWLIPGGVLAVGIANALAALLLTIWLGTRAFTEERRNHTLEGLVTTTMGNGRIVFDKLCAVLWPTFPLWVATGPMLALGVPHLRMVQFFNDPDSAQWSWLLAGGFAWVWTLPVWIAVAGGSMMMGLLARSPRSAFGLTVVATAALLVPAALVGQLFPEMPVLAPLARLWAPGLTGRAGVFSYLVSGAAWSLIALVLPLVLSRRLRDWCLRVLLLLAALGLAAPTLVQAQDEEPVSDLEALHQLSMRVKPWLDGHVRDGGWTAAVVELHNLGAATEGQLVIDDAMANEEGARWLRHVELPSGGTKRMLVPFQAVDRGAVRGVRFTAAGGRIALGELRLQRAKPSDVLVAVLGDDPLGLHAALRTATVGAVPRHGQDTLTDSPPNTDGPALRSVRATNLPVRDLPASSQVLSGVDWIVWPHADPSALSQQQSEALANWVADGGHLLLTVTDTFRQLQDSPLDDVLPGRLDRPTTDQVSQLARKVDQTRADILTATGSEELPTTSPVGPTPVARFQPRVGTQVFARTDDGLPLWVGAPRGHGTVHLLLADLRLAPFPAFDREALWRTLLFLPLDGGVDSAFPIPLDQVDGERLASRQDDLEAEVRRSLSDVPGLAPLPIGWLVMASLAYLLLIGPIDYLVLRKLKRQVFTWVTYPTTILVFTTAAFLGLRSTKGSQAMLTQVELVDVMPDVKRWQGTSFVGVFSTRKAELSVASSHRDAVVTSLHEAGFLPSPRLMAGYGPGAAAYKAETWTMAYLKTEWVRPDTRRLIVTRREGGDIQVENQLGFDLDDLNLYQHGRSTGSFGAVADGEVVVSSTAGEKTPVFRDHHEWMHASRRGKGSIRYLLVGHATTPVDQLALTGLSPVNRSDVIVRQPISDAEMEIPEESPP